MSLSGRVSVSGASPQGSNWLSLKRGDRLKCLLGFTVRSALSYTPTYILCVVVATRFPLQHPPGGGLLEIPGNAAS